MIGRNVVERCKSHVLAVKVVLKYIMREGNENYLVTSENLSIRRDLKGYLV